MKQVYEHYEKWEDYRAGMFALSDILDKDKKVIGAINILSDPAEFYNVLQKVLSEWPTASAVNLTNRGQNRRAWLGAAACMYRHKTPEYLTRIAWNLLNKDIQDAANRTADKVIMEYETQQPNAQTLFG